MLALGGVRFLMGEVPLDLIRSRVRSIRVRSFRVLQGFSYIE